MKGYSKKCQTFKKVLIKLVALLESYVTFEKVLLIIPGFHLFMRVGFFFGCPYYNRCTEVWKKSYITCQTAYTKTTFARPMVLHILGLASTDAKYNVFEYQCWWLLLHKLGRIIQYISNNEISELIPFPVPGF